MKIGRICFCFILLGSVAIGVSAQTLVDPKVIINKTLDPACIDFPNSICYRGDGSISEPLIEDYGNLKSFIFEPTGPGAQDAHLDTLFLAFTKHTIPDNTALSCGSNIWANCQFVFNSNFDAVFEFFGGGFLAFDEGGDVSLQPEVSAIPEPGTYLLFGTGLIAIFSVAKRRLAVRPTVV